MGRPNFFVFRRVENTFAMAGMNTSTNLKLVTSIEIFSDTRMAICQLLTNFSSTHLAVVLRISNDVFDENQMIYYYGP